MHLSDGSVVLWTYSIFIDWQDEQIQCDNATAQQQRKQQQQRKRKQHQLRQKQQREQ